MGDSADSAGQPQFSDQLTYWKGLKQQAEDGTFALDTSLATDLKKHAETMLHHLEDELLAKARQLGALDGFGALPSSTALKTAFETKADNSDGSLTAQYNKAIDIVTTMRDTYNIVITKLTAGDQESADALKKQAGKV